MVRIKSSVIFILFIVDYRLFEKYENKEKRCREWPTLKIRSISFPVNPSSSKFPSASNIRSADEGQMDKTSSTRTTESLVEAVEVNFVFIVVVVVFNSTFFWRRQNSFILRRRRLWQRIDAVASSKGVTLIDVGLARVGLLQCDIAELNIIF